MMPQKKYVRRFKWESNYDDLLIELVKEKQGKTWTKVAEQLKIQILNMPFSHQDSFPTGKQCRERWVDHLDPSVSHDAFMMDQIDYIIKRKEQGVSYSLIGKELNHPANQVKNAYNRFIKGKQQLMSSEPVIRDYVEFGITLSPSTVLTTECSPPIPDIDTTYRTSCNAPLQQYSFFATPPSFGLSFDSPGLDELVQEMINDTHFIYEM